MRRRILREVNVAEWLTAVTIAVALIAWGIGNVYGNHHTAGWTLIAVGLAALVVVTGLYGGHLAVVAQDYAASEQRDSARTMEVLPAIRVTPIFDHGFRYLAVENLGGSAEFRAQIEVVEGREHWLRSGWPTPLMPYNGCWDDNSPTGVIKLFQGQTGRIAMFGLLSQGGDKDPHCLPQFSHFDESSSHRFFGNRIDSLDDVERFPLVWRVTIGSLPSMKCPFVATYRFRLNVALEEIS